MMPEAQRKYKVGKATAKQRQLKAILNKLTPQNFEKLFEQVKAIKIDDTGTLNGVISQIFETALMQPTFCEMCANFCYHLAGVLPDFSEDNKKITAKRLLLNKCQEEFERRGREEEEANKADEEGETRRLAEEREEKRLKARRRMLGNIILIGELYKKKLLPKRIMHVCIKELLGEYQNTDEEDVEALCKLMTTIGEMTDRPKVKEHMDTYFETMTMLSNNMKLSSRVRFMLKDAINLRKNKWQQRRKVEGPKKIEDVHRDAAQERQHQAGRLARNSSINGSSRRVPVDFGVRGSPMLSSSNAQVGGFRGSPTQARGFGTQDFGFEDRQFYETVGQSISVSSLPSRGLECGSSFDRGSSETLESKKPLASVIDDVSTKLSGVSMSTVSASPAYPSISMVDSAGDSFADVSSELSVVGTIVGGTETVHHGKLEDSSPSEHLKNETSVTEEQGQNKLSESFKQDESSEICTAHGTSETTGPVKQAKEKSAATARSFGNDVWTSESAEVWLDELVTCHVENDTPPDKMDVSVCTNTDSIDVGKSLDNHSLAMDAPLSKGSDAGYEESSSNEFSASDQQSDFVRGSDVSAASSKHEAESVESIVGSFFLAVPGFREKPVELTRSKSTNYRVKKKFKEILQKVDAAGTTSDLCMAYKGPEEKKEDIISSGVGESSSTVSSPKPLPPGGHQGDPLLNSEDTRPKVLPDDWEDAADISTPKLGISNVRGQACAGQGQHDRNGPDADRWQRATNIQHKVLIPSPQTPLQMMHTAVRKYEVGKVTDEDEAKQRQLKAILNKLTPQNFEKLFEQVKAVNIDSIGTLNGVISQIFDTALMEPTFCEMNANFCYHLAGVLPDFSEDNEKITFKRLLLNKCQEEFKRGEIEEEEANKADEEGETNRLAEEREEKRLEARRRMLGIIRLIKELCKKKMLTLSMKLKCIRKLDEYRLEEPIEALCKFMSTIEEVFDHTKVKKLVDECFETMRKFSNEMKLSSRVRFVLKDAIDLRKNKWEQRRKVEGPKKIEEVRRDAAQERQHQASRLVRNRSINASAIRVPVDFGVRGSPMLSSPSAQMGGFRGSPTPACGFGTQDFHFEDRQSYEARTPLVPLPHRPGDDSITLGLQAGLAGGMSIRGPPDIGPGEWRRMTPALNGLSNVSERPMYGVRDDLVPRFGPDRFTGPDAYDQLGSQERNLSHINRDARNIDHGFDRNLGTSPPSRSQGPSLTQNVPSEMVWPEERLIDMSMAAIKEFYSARDEKEVTLRIKDLNSSNFRPSMISLWINDSFERKDIERDLLAKLLVNLTRSQDGILTPAQLIKGFESVLTTLEDAVIDAPKAAEFLGRIFAKAVMDDVVTLGEISQLLHDGGEEPGRLLQIGLAGDVLGITLEMIKAKKGENVLNDIRNSSNLRLEDFRPPGPNSSRILENFMAEGSILPKTYSGSSASFNSKKSKLIRCNCGELACLRISWTEKNPGRRFWSCPNYKVCTQKIFLWEDAEFTERANEEINDQRMQIAMLEREVARFKERDRREINKVGHSQCVDDLVNEVTKMEMTVVDNEAKRIQELRNLKKKMVMYKLVALSFAVLFVACWLFKS